MNEYMMILTEEYGWIPILDLKVGNIVYSLDCKTNEVTKSSVKDIIYTDGEDYPYLIQFQNRSFKDIILPTVKYPIYNRFGKFEGFFKAQDIYDNKIDDISHKYIPKKIDWKGYDIVDEEGVLTIPKLREDLVECDAMRKYENVSGELKLPCNAFLDFTALFLNLGSIYPKLKKLFIYDVRKYAANETEDILKELGIEYEKLIVDGNYHDKLFIISDLRMYQAFEGCYDTFTFKLPYIVRQLPKKYLFYFYNRFYHYSGRNFSNYAMIYDKKFKQVFQEFLTQSEKLALDLNEMLIKIGLDGIIYIDNDDIWLKYNNGRLMLKEPSRQMFTVDVIKSRNFFMDRRFLRYRKVKYEGKIVSLKLEGEYNTIYVSQQGKSHWICC